MIEAPTVLLFFSELTWSAPDYDPYWITDWEGTGVDIPNRLWNVEALDADGVQQWYASLLSITHVPPDPSWATLKVTAVEVTGTIGAPPDPPGLEHDGEVSATTTYEIPVPPDPDPGPPQEVGGYVRHRNRMVSTSVYEDVRDVLIACRWMAGTTSHEVDDPNNPGSWAVITTAEEDVLPLLEGHPVNLIDAFPESKGQNVAGEPETGKTPPNTLAVDSPLPGEVQPRELGSTAQLIPYTFLMMFFGTSDAVAQALLSDLSDRYAGRLCRNAVIGLWDFNQDDPTLVVQMDVENFIYKPNSGETATPSDVFLWFAELDLIDDVD